MKRSGFTLIELLIGTAILSVIMMGGATVLMVAQASWTTVNTNIELEENSRLALTKLSKELQESGTNSLGVIQVRIFDNAGDNNTDIIRFSIPLCLCGEPVIDSNGNVAFWGAPLQWGSNGCSQTFFVDSSGKTTICHHPPGNPENVQTLQISVNALDAHVAHGDWPGECQDCDTNDNKFIEYRLNSSNQLIRRILKNDASIVLETVIANNISDFETFLSADNSNVTVNIDLEKIAVNKRVCHLTRSQTIYLRN